MHKILVIAVASALLLASSSTLISSVSIQSETELSVSDGGSTSLGSSNIIKGRHSNPMIPAPLPDDNNSQPNKVRPIMPITGPIHWGLGPVKLPQNSSTRNPFILPGGLHGGHGPVVIKPRPNSTASDQNSSSTRNPFILPNGVHLGPGPVVLNSTLGKNNPPDQRPHSHPLIPVPPPVGAQNGSHFVHPGLPIGPGPVVLKTTTTKAPSSAGGCNAPKLDKLAKRLAKQLQLETSELEQVNRLVKELLAKTTGKRKNCSPPAEAVQLSQTTIVVDLMQRFKQQHSQLCH